MITDANGLKLEDGLYTGPDPTGIQDDIYKIIVRGDSFTAEYWEGFLSITNFEDAARHFRRLAVPTTNARFLDSHLK